jgi:3-oxoadipate CoA-transferase alpha subunit
VIDKQVKTTADAVAGVRDGSTVLVAGFGAVGVADHLLDALYEQGARDLTVVANNSGNGDYGLARLINSGARAQGDLLLSALGRLQRLSESLSGQEP